MPSALMTTARIGLSPAATELVSTIAAATASAVALTAGTNSEITASIPASPSSSGNTARYESAVAEPSMSTGLPRLASAGSRSAARRTVSSLSRGSSSPDGFAGIRTENPEAARVRQDRDSAAAGHRLRREQRGDVDELLERSSRG